MTLIALILFGLAVVSAFAALLCFLALAAQSGSSWRRHEAPKAYWTAYTRGNGGIVVMPLNQPRQASSAQPQTSTRAWTNAGLPSSVSN